MSAADAIPYRMQAAVLVFEFDREQPIRGWTGNLVANDIKHQYFVHEVKYADDTWVITLDCEGGESVAQIHEKEKTLLAIFARWGVQLA